MRWSDRAVERLGESMRTCWRTVVASSCFWLSALPAGAQWAQCASDLDDLHAVARAVYDAADRVASLETAMRNGEEAYARCLEDRRNFRVEPRTNPIPESIQGSACSLEIAAVRSAEQRYGTEMNRARGAFADLAFAVQTVERSCQYPLAAMAPAPGGAARSPTCDRFLRSRLGEPVESLRGLCSAEMSPEECRACLGGPPGN